MLLWFLLATVSLLFVAIDIRTTPESPVLKWGFVLLTAYTGVIGAFLYVLGCREPLPGLHERYVAARWRQVLGSTMHCVAGDGIGILAGAVLSSVSRTSRHTSSDGAATSASARPLACSRTWKLGSAEDYARIFGGSGRTGPIASKNYAVVACQSSMQRSSPVHRRGSGACPDTRRSNKPCATTISPHSVFPDSSSPPKLNPVEPPGTD